MTATDDTDDAENSDENTLTEAIEADIEADLENARQSPDVPDPTEDLDDE